jgi:hypothetical protein
MAIFVQSLRRSVERSWVQAYPELAALRRSHECGTQNFALPCMALRSRELDEKRFVRATQEWRCRGLLSGTVIARVDNDFGTDSLSAMSCFVDQHQLFP